uniref:Uncharacterized protein n=1 Tax=Timema poppense TaxID=170557 RepID=A0A7R9D8D6_TIMPO|nr:unnamed protein product [Timema poppensis]
MCSALKFPNLGVPEPDKRLTVSELRAALNRVRHTVVGPDNVPYASILRLTDLTCMMEISRPARFNCLTGWSGVLPRLKRSTAINWRPKGLSINNHQRVDVIYIPRFRGYHHTGLNSDIQSAREVNLHRDPLPPKNTDKVDTTSIASRLKWLFSSGELESFDTGIATCSLKGQHRCQTENTKTALTKQLNEVGI